MGDLAALVPMFIWATLTMAIIGFHVINYLAKINQELERLREKDEPGKDYENLLKKEVSKALASVLIISGLAWALLTIRVFVV